MSLLIGILTFFLVIVCLLLWLLILVQLPKKEAGMGAAFGADTTAALFGAGSGNTLTSLTKWMATAFVLMCVLVSWLNAHQSHSRTGGIREALGRSAAVTPGIGTGLSLTGLPAQVTAPTAIPTNAPALTSPATAPLTSPTPAPVPAPAGKQ